jgi:hypothetical protein
MESIPYNLLPLSIVMDQVRVLQGHCSIYSMDAGKYLYLIPNQFQDSIYPP